MNYKMIRLFGPARKREPVEKRTYKPGEPRYKTTPEEDKPIIRDLLDGYSTYELSLKYGHSRGLIRRIAAQIKNNEVSIS